MGFISGAMSGMPQMPQQPGQPIPSAGGKGQPSFPFQGQPPGQPSPGASANFRPEGYVSPYANYGFDPGFSQYLDNRYYNTRGMDGGQLNYDPTNQMFTTVGARRAPGSGPDPTTSLANMQRTYEIENQLRTMGPRPDTNGMLSSMDIQNYTRNNPEFMKLQNELYSINNPGQPMPQFPPQKPGTFNPFDRPGQPQPQTQPMNPQGPVRPYGGLTRQPQGPQQRGLGGLQTALMNKFRNRLG